MERPADMLSPTRGETRSENRQSGVPAFKEWAIVCDSIARGETSLIFRKGGIAEGRDGFQFKHQSFFLFPTYFHGQIERTRLSHVRDVKPQQDAVAISVFVRAYRISPVWEFPLHPSYGGCRSWVTLPRPPFDLRMEKVLSEEEQSRRRSLVTGTIE